ncbi:MULTISPECIES: nucleotidyltransferase family protein [Bacteria]
MRPPDFELTDQASGAVLGLVLAAGAGTRFGGPKALARDGNGMPWVVRAVRTLRAGGCGQVLVALGASATEARDLVPPNAEIVVVPDWRLGLSATISKGLAAAGERSASALVIMPVDTPDAPPAVVRRVIAAAAVAPRRALVQATYGGDPGHPVLIGAEHFVPLSHALSGDRGARAYLARHHALAVSCEDLWSGDDIDTPSFTDR